jgi:hypothetical protein
MRITLILRLYFSYNISEDTADKKISSNFQIFCNKMSSSGVTRSAIATLKRSHETRRSNVASAKSPVAASLDLKEAIESARYVKKFAFF